MRNFLLAAFASLLLAVSAPTTAFGQSAITQAQVVAACTLADNNANCAALTSSYIGQIQASGSDIAAQRQAINALIVGLAQSGGDTAQIANAIDTIALEAPEIANSDAVAAIADAVRTGDTDTVTASIGALASPN